MKVLFIILIHSLLTITSTSQDYKKHKGQMTPLTQELLKKPVTLEDHCRNVKIIEWRGTNGYSTPNKRHIKAFNAQCNKALASFFKFMKDRHSDYTIKGKLSKFKTKLCLMPVGSSPRDLNDREYRFSRRMIKVNLWGYYEKATNYIYIRNDVMNVRKVIWSHELFHSFSHQFGIFKQHTGNRDKADERMAKEFTTYLGLGK